MCGRSSRGRAGCTVWVKHENHTPTGAFKVRGGLVYLDRLRAAESASAWGHLRDAGQSWPIDRICRGARRVPATIYVPRGNSPDQNSAIRLSARRLVEFGRDFDEAKHEAIRVAAAQGLHFVPSFHPIWSSASQAMRSSCSAPARAGCGVRRRRHGLGNLRADPRARPDGAQDRNHRGGRRQGAGDGAARLPPGTPVSTASAKPLPTGSRRANRMRMRSRRYAAARRAWSRSRRTPSPMR